MNVNVIKWSSLKVRITLASLVIFVFSIWALSFYTSRVMKDDLQQQLGEQLLTIASVLADDINQELDFRLRSLEKITEQVTPAILSNAPKLQKLLEERPILQLLFNGGYFAIQADGTTIADFPVSTGRVGMNVSEKGWMIDALKGKSAIGKPVIGKMLQVPVFTMASPIRDSEGKVVGVLAGVVDLSKPNFLDKITGKKLGKAGGYLLIAPQHKLIVTATDKKRIMSPMPVPGVNPLFDRYNKGFEGFGRAVNSLGVEELTASKKIPVAGWFLIVKTPISEAFASFYRTQQHIIVATIFLSILVGCTIWWVLKRQLTPIFDTVSTLTLMSEGSQPPNLLPVVCQDEIGQLVGGFNRLLKTLEQREEELRTNVEDLEDSQRIAHVGSWRLDVASNQTVWSEELYKMCGFDPKLPPPPYTEHQKLFTPESWEKLSAAVQSTHHTGIPYSLELEMIRVNGSPGWMWAYGTSVLDVNGVTVSLRGMAQDITERKQAESKLRLNETRLESLVHILQFSAQTIREFLDNALNEAVKLTESTVGYIYFYHEERQEFELNSWSHEVMKECAVLEYQTIYHLDKTGIWGEAVRQRKPIILNDFTTENPLRKGYPQGHVHLTRFMTVPVFSNDRIVAVVGIANKTSDYDEENVLQLTLLMNSVWKYVENKRGEEERLKLESQLHQAQKMESIGSLAGGVAHDFNNKLSVILGHAYLALTELPENHPIRENLEEIRKAADQSADLTRQLLAFARKQTIVTKVLDLNETVTGMLKMLGRLIGEDIHLTWQPAPNLWLLKFDPSQVDQILANLCVNARDSISKNGKILIETGNSIIDGEYCARHADVLPGEYVRLIVSDNGCGMDKKILDRIFEPFFTTKETGKGTGLGLATVFGIVKQNNGFINVYSEPGMGTTFTIYLPRHVGKTEQALKEGMEKTAPRGQETILLVEDELAILNMASIILTKQGYSVLQANTPAEAIRLTKEHSGVIELLITDVIMPEMNGKDLAHKLQFLLPQLKCLYMSGYTADAIAQHGVLAEGVYFIQKPFSLTDLATKVREALDSD
ncbi:MAG: GAF domain-containing protein [Desulfuromonadales bacterium]